MGQPIIQTSFNSGEWAPALNARVDLAKYHSGAALLRNFMVDYRGGATTRPGTKYVLTARSAVAGGVRLIPFQASLGVTYLLEFGAGYIRFYQNGGPVLESATSITAASGSPTVFTDNTHGYSNGDWIAVGGSYYIVQNATSNTFTLTDLYGNAINSNPFTLPASAQRVYTLLNTPYQSKDLFGIKYAQNVNQLILCHPNYPPQILTLNTATNWTLAPINFGATISSPTGLSISSSAGSGTDSVGYKVTAVDVNGQESAPALVSISGLGLNASYTNTVTWSAVSGAVSYNVYRSVINFANTAIPAGVQFGFVGNVTTTEFLDSNIGPDFSQGAPIVQNPFSGSGVATITATAVGNNYTIVPTVTLDAPPAGIRAQATCGLSTTSVTLNSGGTGYHVGDLLTANYNIQIQVTSLGIGGAIAGFTVVNAGFALTGSVQTTALTFSGGFGHNASINVTWGISSLQLTNPGTGYISPPNVVFTNGGGGSGAAAVTTLGAASAGNPQVPAFAQQRMFMGGPVQSPAQFNMSQPGAQFNYNVTFPAEADNAIQATLTSTTLNTIKSAIPVSAGLLIFTDKGAWLVNGGSNGSPFSATSLVANPQTFSGASDLPPIVTPTDILYVQAKGSIVRDLAYNFYLANYVGTDISILSSHLFYGFSLIDWAWAEEPFKTVWATRSDGQLLTLAFVKEQELIAWAHHDTNGQFKSVAVVAEATAIGEVDAVYVVVQRQINGQTLNYIERFTELYYPNDYISSWQVDAGIGYNGPAATTFSGAQHLAGASVTGLADGVVINFTMPASGTFVFGNGGTPGLTGIANASVVTVGLAFTPQLQTLALDLGEPTVQSKRKKVSAVTVRCRQALGLSAGRTFGTLVPMKDLVIGNIGTMSNALVSGLVTSDARVILDPQYDVFGQFCIQQSNPYPASILGVIPEIEVGDSTK